MLWRVEAVLNRIEALPGENRFALTFTRPDSSEQTATAEVVDGVVRVAEASLPAGWRLDSPQFRATVDAVLAFAAARSTGPQARVLRDVAGGWDVGLGNVVLSADGQPTCTAHGEMAAQGEAYECAQCGARAALSG